MIHREDPVGNALQDDFGYMGRDAVGFFLSSSFMDMDAVAPACCRLQGGRPTAGESHHSSSSPEAPFERCIEGFQPTVNICS